MIRVKRGPRPTILKERAKEWLAELLAASTPDKIKIAINKYRHKEIKKALSKTFCGKCAYCESQILHIEYGHIEHYRPKSGSLGRRDLTFAWSNLLLACGRCNGSQFKGAKFPGPQEGGPILDPCRDEPIIHLRFHYDPIVRLASVYGITKRGEVTQELLGLNRSDLRAVRSKYISHLYVLSILASTNTEASALLQEAKGASSQYAAFARALF